MSDNCEVCGRDLYSEPNILLETRAVMDKLINNLDTDCTGRPMFVIVIGDNGSGSAMSDELHIPDNEINPIFVDCLKELLRVYGPKKRNF